MKLCRLPRTIFKNEAQHVPSRFFNGEGGTRRRVYRTTQCFEDFTSFGAQFDGPHHFAPGEQMWGSGQKDGYLWFIQAGYGFDKMYLEDGTTMLNGMIEPGLFVCDEKHLMWGSLTVSSAIMYTHTTAYRISNRQWREFVYTNSLFRSFLYRVNGYFLQMRKLRLIKMKHQDKKAYWEETKARFPGIELY